MIFRFAIDLVENVHSAGIQTDQFRLQSYERLFSAQEMAAIRTRSAEKHF